VLVYNAPGAIAAIKKHRPRAKVCLWAVNALFRTYNRAEIGRVIAASHRIICCSQFIANDLTLRLGQKSPKIKVVYNGVDMGKFLPGQSTVGNVGRILRILFIGRMVPQKGPDLLLKAAQLVHRKGVPFKLRMVGSRGYGLYKDLSPYEEELRTLAEPIKDSVEFQPSISRDELLKEYQAADVFCAPSNWDDPFPLTVLEAMSCGVPTVASRRGGIPEGGAEDILYFNPPDFAELAERLCFFLCDPKLRLEYSARCRTRAMRFDWQNQYHDLQRALTE
jgi:glycosyltransferase involved in cell wall biosynthesis